MKTITSHNCMTTVDMRGGFRSMYLTTGLTPLYSFLNNIS